MLRLFLKDYFFVEFTENGEEPIKCAGLGNKVTFTV